jgi:hypothetical protein
MGFSQLYLCPFYSYIRKASSGERRDAFQAGNIPDTSVIVSERNQTLIKLVNSTLCTVGLVIVTFFLAFLLPSNHPKEQSNKQKN